MKDKSPGASEAAAITTEERAVNPCRIITASLAFLIATALPGAQAAAAEVDAAGYYTLRCATCHGATGEGTRNKAPSLGPPLRGNPLVIAAPAEMLANIIRRGRGGQQRVYDDAYPNMPAFDAGMVPDAVGLATYLKTVLQQQGTDVPVAPEKTATPEAVPPTK